MLPKCNMINRLRAIIIPMLAWSLQSMSAGEGFSISGHIPGLSEGSVVKLVDIESKKESTIGETHVSDGKFLLTGHIDQPTLCMIRIYPDSTKRDCKAFRIMVENTPMDISAMHLDSIPAEFYSGSLGMIRENNISVTGGERQRQYREFRKATLPADIAAKQAHYDCFHRSSNPMSVDSLSYNSYLVAKEKASRIHKQYAIEHPESSISGYHLIQLLETPFALTDNEIDRIQSSIGNADPYRREHIAQAVQTARSHTKFAKFTDMTAYDQSGKTGMISDYIGNNDRVLLIDFWASWCGPCRAALKQLKKIYGKYHGKVEFLSISVDENKQDWIKAMEKEQMPWPQLRIDPENAGKLRECYQAQSIPTFVIIMPDGSIVHHSHDPKPLDLIISGLVN